MKQMIPANLNIKKLLERHSTDSVPAFHKDKVYWVCHSIYQQMQYLSGDNKMTHPEKEEPFYVPLSSEILQSALGRSYPGLMKWMIHAGIIQSDGSWQNERVSQGYRLTDHYLGASRRWVTLILRQFLKRSEDVRIKPYYVFKRTLGWLEKQFNPDDLEIDVKAANEKVRSILQDEITQSNGDRDRILIAQSKANTLILAIDALHKGQYGLTQDSFGYRYHTPLTRLNKEIRQFVTWRGEGLVQIDISGSQLFFSNFLMDDNHWLTRKNLNFKPFLREIWENIEIMSKSSSKSKIYYNYCTMSVQSLKNSYSKGFQENTFFEKTVNGQLYEYLLDELDKQKNFPPEMSYQEKRSLVKKNLLMQIFANEKNPTHKGVYYSKYNRQIWETFCKLFPDVVEIYKNIKEVNYKDMSRLLQRIESVCMLGLICGRIYKEMPHIPIYTIHDCIATTPEYVPVIQQIMKEEIAGFIGAAPSFSISSWREQGLLTDIYHANAA